MLDTEGLRVTDGISLKASARVLEMFEWMYVRDLIDRQSGQSMVDEYEKIVTTQDIVVDLNTPQQMMRGYAAAKPADILIQVFGSNHAYLVVKNEPVYLADDFTIDPNASRITCLSPEGEKSYTYTDMYTKEYFVPITVSALADGTLRPLQVTLSVTAADGVRVNVTSSRSITECEIVLGSFTARADGKDSEYLVYTGKALDAAAAALADGTHTLTVKVSAGGDTVTVSAQLAVKQGKIAVLQAEAPDHADTCPAKAMTDVDKDAWYHDAVDYVLTHGIMGGYNASTFGPDDTLTRAQVVQVLYNKEGTPDLNGAAHAFPDVAADQWYNNAVTWGAAQKVVSGYGDGRFGPEDKVTLEQAVVILWNWSGTPAAKGPLDGIGAHSDWAADALSWAVESGLLEGMPYGALTDGATRAQTAQMLMNYLKVN